MVAYQLPSPTAVVIYSPLTLQANVTEMFAESPKLWFI